MINSFRGPYYAFSNFYPCEVEYDGEKYKTVEHAFQAAKTTVPHQRRFIRSSPTPNLAKSFGRAVPLRPGWNALRMDVMRSLIAQKFAKGTQLAQLLLSTGDEEIVEGNTWGDTFWGVFNGEGENWLGRILMEQREKLRGN